MKLRRLALAGLFVMASLPSRSDLLDYERLRLKNTFERPEDVVRYYVSRDAAGFVWSGFLDVERRAFTTWSEAPQRDAFFVAKSYEIQNARRLASVQGRETAEVLVRYKLVGIADAHGTLAKAPPEMVVRFGLERNAGRWRITRPTPEELAPVVLDKKFALTR